LIALPDSRADIYNLPAFPVPNIPRAKKLPLNDNIHRQLPFGWSLAYVSAHRDRKAGHRLQSQRNSNFLSGSV